MQPHQYLSNLTPLRGIAAVWVYFYHAGAIAQFVSPASTQLIAKGYLMVDLFFIMSGFIMCHVYRRSFETGLNTENFKRFIVARFARIYPLHLFVLIALILWIAKMGFDPTDIVMDPTAIPTNLFLIQSFGIHKVFTWNVPSWSISAEWWAYIAFPFLVFFLYRRKRLAAALLFLFVIIAYPTLMFWLPRKDPFNPTAVPHNLDISFDYGFLRGLAGFIAGMLVYETYNSGLFRKFFQKDLTALLLIGCTLLCMHIGMNDGFYIILFAGLVYTFACNNGRLHIICNNRLAQYLGKISYSIYMTGVFIILPFLMGLIKLPGIQYTNGAPTAGFLLGAGYCLFFLLIQIGISTLTYYGVEKPCRKFINEKWGKETMPVYA